MNNAGNQTIDGPHWLLFISLIWKSMGMNNIFKNIFCVQLKKETYTGLEQHEGK